MDDGRLINAPINTDVKDGQLTLSGSVESEIEKSLAAELVANLDGVEEVDNQLTVVKSKQDQFDSMI